MRRSRGSRKRPASTRITTYFAHTYEPTGPFGAKGIGEAATNPVAAAYANAICNAIGVRFYELPITPEKILAALKKTRFLEETWFLGRRGGALMSQATNTHILVNEFTYHEPATLAEASELLLKHDARLMAGGTDVLVHMKMERSAPGHVVSLRGIPSL